MQIDVKSLEKVTSTLLSKLRESMGDTIELPYDYYWDIAMDDLYNPYQKPVDIVLGQLSDDLEEVRKLSVSDNDAIPYDLKRIASILTALSLSTW
jgi:hypothetical protein